MTNLLRGSQVYTSGPIDYVVDWADAVSWRNDITDFLSTMGVTTLDPCNKPTLVNDETPELRHQIQKLKDDGDFRVVQTRMKDICRVDLRMVDKSDFLIAHLDLDITMTGTIWEIAQARILRKPVLIHCKQGKAAIPNWFFGVCDHSEMFGSWDDLKAYILSVDSGDVSPDKYWIFFKE